jgi:hypothetical protein
MKKVVFLFYILPFWGFCQKIGSTEYLIDKLKNKEIIVLIKGDYPKCDSCFLIVGNRQNEDLSKYYNIYGYTIPEQTRKETNKVTKKWAEYFQDCFIQCDSLLLENVSINKLVWEEMPNLISVDIYLYDRCTFLDNSTKPFMNNRK